MMTESAKLPVYVPSANSPESMLFLSLFASTTALSRAIRSADHVARSSCSNVQRLSDFPDRTIGHLVDQAECHERGCDPGATRTPDLLVRSQALYPLSYGVSVSLTGAIRHTAATLLLEAGVQPHAVAKRLGHATPSLVMNVYGHVTDRMQGEATATIDRILGAS